MRVVTRWSGTLGAFAVVAVILGVVAILDTRDQRALARSFLAVGTYVVANDVVLDVHSGRGGDYIETVDVSFGNQRATLTNFAGDPEGNALGAHSPDAGSRYAPPLPVLYKPDAPREAMALVDADELAAARSVPWFSLGAIAVGGIVLLGRGGLWLMGRRRARPVRHQGVG